MVPEAAKEAWEEITDFEYMGIRDWVIFNAVELESSDVVNSIFNKKLSKSIFLS
jgi:hypothetical protein